MKTLSKNDIEKIISRSSIKNESLKVHAGKGDNRETIVDPGLKIKHVPSGLVYTVIKVIDDEKGPKILCQRPGKKLLIYSKSFKDYERQ